MYTIVLVFQCHIEKLVCSPEESQQRAAAEMVYGLVRGMRFWDYQSAHQAWTWLIPVFQQHVGCSTSRLCFGLYLESRTNIFKINNKTY
jgi:hypothetical protein